ncbi:MULTISPECIES: FtsB family cell division protein [Planktomarina]|jgi:cell division protein FtsB|uniref:FtsB family cell division protein n=1 Tax=Planktomarina TaxID=1284657 RepID=UPI0023B70F60|nr:septum formation initiator family protein [Planktomarina temperata]
MRQRSIPPIGPLAVTFVSLTLAAYFIFSAIQGDYGVLRRAAYQTEADGLQRKLSTLQSSIAQLENKTLRLSDHYLDLDLLDQQARDVLGFIRPDEIVIQ